MNLVLRQAGAAWGGWGTVYRISHPCEGRAGGRGLAETEATEHSAG
jgi:hypothetical protein